MTAKQKLKLTAMIAMADSQDHAKRRKLLADHSPVTYGDLRRGHNLSPGFLETQIPKYPEIFEGGIELATGKPTIKLKDGQLESREDLIMRRMLVTKVRQAGATGIRLARLYTGTRIPSKEVQRLLKEPARGHGYREHA
jgi:hypothetical protein